MDKLAFKNQVVNQAKNKQQSIIDDFRQRIEQIKGSEVNINEGQYELDQKALDEESNTQISELADQLNFVVQEMNIINRIKVEDPLHKEVGFGSVVITDKKNFFVSASIEEFEVDGEEFFGLSVQAPIYKEMKGKSKGDHFSWKDEEYEIKEVI